MADPVADLMYAIDCMHWIDRDAIVLMVRSLVGRPVLAASRSLSHSDARARESIMI